MLEQWQNFWRDRRFRTALGLVLFLLLAVLIYPFQMTVVPVWQLRIIDHTGSPVSEINVTEHWQHYLFEKNAHQASQKPGMDGYVTFPERTMRTSLLKQLLTTVRRMSSEGRYAKLEPAASVVAWGSEDHATTVAVYRKGEMPQSEIMVHSLR